MIIAITGCSGSGKTTMLNMLKMQGYRTFDCDSFSVQIIKKNKIVSEKLCQYIEKVPIVNGGIDLSKMNSIFDNNVSAEMQFEIWYQHYLGGEIRKQLTMERKRNGILFADIPFLDKKQLFDCIDKIWVVEADRAICFDRIEERNHYSNEKIEYLIRRSLVSQDTYNRADIIIKNNTSKVELEQQLIKIMSEL